MRDLKSITEAAAKMLDKRWVDRIFEEFIITKYPASIVSRNRINLNKISTHYPASIAPRTLKKMKMELIIIRILPFDLDQICKKKKLNRHGDHAWPGQSRVRVTRFL